MAAQSAEPASGAHRRAACFAAKAGQIRPLLRVFESLFDAPARPSYDSHTSVPEADFTVRMIVPPIAHRRAVDRELVGFFHNHRMAAFNRAISQLCRYYNVKRPRVGWYEYLDWGKTAGKTYEDGRIHLVHPENWKRGRVYKSERMWVQMIYHEMGHYLLWTDAERKADVFMRRMVAGLRAARARRTRRAGIGAQRTARRAGAAASRTRRRRAGVALRAQRQRRARRTRARAA
jgi:predicted SprT family Zn-dependent metalloprotease